MTSSIRRVVTGHSAEGRAVVDSDRPLPMEELATGDAAFVKIWTTAQSPADPTDPMDGAERPTGLTSPGGTVIRVVDHFPGCRSPMHRTRSVDYGIMLEGLLDLELDGGEVVHLRPGDIVVQRGTNHAWVNNSDQVARIAFVLIDAQPVTIGGRSLDELASRLGADHL